MIDNGKDLSGILRESGEPELSNGSLKRVASSQSSDELVDDVAEEANTPSTAVHANNGDGNHMEVNDVTGTAQPMTKSQLKRFRKRQRWEEKRLDRIERRKEKRHSRQARKRAEKESRIAELQAAGIDPSTFLDPGAPPAPVEHVTVPVAFIVDCDFEQYMREHELVSLSSQVVRCYSQNRQARRRAHLFINSWKGKLHERFETVLANTHKNWKGVHLLAEDFVAAAAQAVEVMAGPGGGELIDILQPEKHRKPLASVPCDGDAPISQRPRPSQDDVRSATVYLTADSPHTLDKLEPYTCYVIGGLVDKNREKGLCQRRAIERGVRTAKLPIGQYMTLQSRSILATNHVVEILSNWLDCGDWGRAFFSVMPKRKGGELRQQPSDQANSAEGTCEADGEARAPLDEEAVSNPSQPALRLDGDEVTESHQETLP